MVVLGVGLRLKLIYYSLICSLFSLLIIWSLRRQEIVKNVHHPLLEPVLNSKSNSLNCKDTRSTVIKRKEKSNVSHFWSRNHQMLTFLLEKWLKVNFHYFLIPLKCYEHQLPPVIKILIWLMITATDRKQLRHLLKYCPKFLCAVVEVLLLHLSILILDLLIPLLCYFVTYTAWINSESDPVKKHQN